MKRLQKIFTKPFFKENYLNKKLLCLNKENI